MVKYKCILVIFILSVSVGYTQNLILNGSFEELDTTKVGFEQANDWQIAGSRSPDLYIPTTIPAPRSSSDTNNMGYQITEYGLNYAGARYFQRNSSGYLNYNEHIIGKTISSLTSGVQYCFSCYISLADNLNCGINRIDSYFSSMPYNPTIEVPPYLLYSPPHVWADTLQFYVDKLNWMKIEGIYLASGGENYFTFGNLHFEEDTDTLCDGTSVTGFPNQQIAYYYMDNFSLEEIKPVDAGLDVSITIGDTVLIGNNSDSASSYVWSPNVFIDDVNALNPTVSPQETTTYYVSKTQCSVTTIDSVTVFVSPVGISEVVNTTNVRIYPNPNNGSFRVTHNLPLENNVYIEVMDITGKIVHRELLTTGNQQEVKTQLLNTGLYFVNFKSDLGELMYSTKMNVIH